MNRDFRCEVGLTPGGRRYWLVERAVDAPATFTALVEWCRGQIALGSAGAVVDRILWSMMLPHDVYQIDGLRQANRQVSNAETIVRDAGLPLVNQSASDAVLHALSIALHEPGQEILWSSGWPSLWCRLTPPDSAPRSPSTTS